MNRWSVVMGLMLHAVVVAACSSKVSPGGGSETGFLTCTTDAECGAGQSCVAAKCVDESGNMGVTPPGCADFSGLPTTPPVSFEHDLMPIFGLSCIASSCHDRSAKKAGLVLGDPSACGPPGTSCYDPAAKWKYKFPGPIDPNLLNEVFSNLVASSMTVPGLQRVTPGNPGQSFLIDKISGLENSKQYPVPCQSQDPTRPGACGSDMPLNSPSLCQDSPDKVRAIATWINQGVLMN